MNRIDLSCFRGAIASHGGRPTNQELDRAIDLIRSGAVKNLPDLWNHHLARPFANAGISLLNLGEHRPSEVRVIFADDDTQPNDVVREDEWLRALHGSPLEPRSRRDRQRHLGSGGARTTTSVALPGVKLSAAA